MTLRETPDTVLLFFSFFFFKPNDEMNLLSITEAQSVDWCSVHAWLRTDSFSF